MIPYVAKQSGESPTVINLGCLTGAPGLADAFRAAGTAAYVAPTDYPDGNAALAFVTNLFLLRATRSPSNRRYNVLPPSTPSVSSSSCSPDVRPTEQLQAGASMVGR